MTYKYDWSSVPKEVNWVATENVAGFNLTWGYAKRPEPTSLNLWDGECRPYFIGKNIFSGDWEDSLEQRPKEFGGDY